MNKVQVLQAVADHIDLELFYTVTVGRSLDARLQGDMTPQAITSLSVLECKWEANANGWMQCDVELGKISVHITLMNNI